MTGLLNPLLRPVLGPVLGSITRAGVAKRLTAFSAAKYAIQQDAADVTILVVGDSTGNGSDEWVYLLGQWLASQYATHSVSYRLWNDTTDSYDVAVSLGVGTGTNTIRIWNNSIPGTRPGYLTGSKFAAAVSNLSTVHLVLWNHGKNTTSQGHPSLTRGEFLGCMEMVRQAQPIAAHVMILQSPNRDDSAMDYVIPIVREICADRTDTLAVDVYAAFNAHGKASSLYVDNLHPSAEGSALWTSEVEQKWKEAAASPFTSLPAWLDAQDANLIVNGDFASWTGATPASWSAINGATVTKNTTEKDGASPYSAAVSGTSASGRLFQQLSAPAATALAGKQVTLAVRQKIPAGSTANCGRIGISYTGGSASSIGDVGGMGGWRWLIISGETLPANNVILAVSLYSDTAASAGSTAYYDRAILIEGDIPHDMA